jgi:hypothetical protein
VLSSGWLKGKSFLRSACCLSMPVTNAMGWCHWIAAEFALRNMLSTFSWSSRCVVDSGYSFSYTAYS